MNDDLSTERTTVVAIYSTPHDAEVARGRLEDEDIRAFTTADDAGCAHVEMQRANGVRLIVLERDAVNAQEALEGTGLLPRTRSDEREGRPRT